jgi:hypothetical protein
MQSGEKINPMISARHDYTWGIGAALIAMGIILLVDQYLKTGWLTQLILPVSGFVFLGWGIHTRRLGLVIAGSILAGLGLGGFLAFSRFFAFSTNTRVGILLAAFALGWVLITVFNVMLMERMAWWPLIPASILVSIGICFLIPWQPLAFFFYPLVGLGMVFLAWGLVERLIGLVIPGSLLLGIGPGIYFAWTLPFSGNGLTQAGVMLVCFAMGWGFITLFSRVIIPRFIWWPLIPGGILAMTGWGLYIGGSPQHALSFIGNTTSVSLILFGLYLMLWRTGFRK